MTVTKSIPSDLLDTLLSDYQKPEDLLGENGLLKQLTKALVECALEAELTDHFGHAKHDPVTHPSGNTRNGKSKKTLKGDFGELPIAVPRDRQGHFEPQLIPKHQTRWAGFDDKPVLSEAEGIISLYARGMTVREIQSHLEELYGAEVSPSLISSIAQAKGDAVIDNGASSFIALSTYIKEMGIPDIIKNLGHDLIIHTVITGGQALNDTLVGFAQMAHHLSGDTKFVVWLNPFWGEVKSDGKSFEQMNVYKANKEAITALIQIPELKQETFGHDLSTMLSENLTFEEAINDPAKTIMTRQRLKIIQDDLFKRLDAAVVI